MLTISLMLTSHMLTISLLATKLYSISRRNEMAFD